MTKFKYKLYEVKKALKGLFYYPPMTLGKLDYDLYWQDKRGKDIGELSDWQRIRADISLGSLSSFKEPISIVDIGCGDGSILKYIKERRPVSKAHGADVSEFALAQAQRFGIETVKIDINNREEMSGVPNGDVILMFEILEHIPHSEEFLLSVYDKAGKAVLFSFPNTGYLLHRLRLLFGRFPLQWRLFPGEHLRFWTYRDLKWWLDSLGFRNRKIFCYKGVPILNKLWPSLFAAGFLVYVPKQ